jgi:hypothetical protein
MANEIRTSVRLQVTKGNLTIDRSTNSGRATMSGTRMSSVVQNIGTTYEAVSISSEVGTAGWAYLKNNDTTNYVEVGLEVSAAFHPFLKLKAGEAAVLRLATDTIFARADTAATDLEITVLED